MVAQEHKNAPAFFVEAIYLGGLLLLLAALLTFRQFRGRAVNPEVTCLLAAGGLSCVGAAIWLARQKRRALATTPANTGRLDFPIAAFGFALLAITGEIGSRALNIPALAAVSLPLQGLMFWGGVALVVWGTSGVGWLSLFRRWLRWFLAKREGWMLAALLASALALRLWRLDSAFLMSIDDGINFFPLSGPTLFDNAQRLLLPREHQLTLLYAQLQAAALNWLGYDLFAVRLMNALFGAFGVAALYLLARTLFDSRMALISAALLATFPPHLHFSRLAMLHMADAAFGTFALAFFARGLKTDRREDWALCGASLGLTQYFFAAGQLFFPPLIVLWLLATAIFDLTTLRRRWRGLLLALIAALLVALPGYYVRATVRLPFPTRLESSGISLEYWFDALKDGLDEKETELLIGQVSNPFLVYISRPERALYYAGEQPMILGAFVPLFLAGVGYLLLRRRTPWLYVPLWIVALSCANMLLSDATQYPRYIVGFPALALAMGAGLRYVVGDALPRRAAFMKTVAAALVGLVCLVQVVYYFALHLPTLREQIWARIGHPDSVDAALRAANFPDNVAIYLISEHEVNIEIPEVFVRLYRYDPAKPPDTIETLTLDEVTPEFVASLPMNRDYAFFIEANRPDSVALLRARFPLEPPLGSSQTDIPPDKQFILYYHHASASTHSPPQ